MVTHLVVEGMMCPNCVRHVDRGIRSVPGVRLVSVDLETGGATVTHSEDVTYEELIKAVEQEGYKATVAA